VAAGVRAVRAALPLTAARRVALPVGIGLRLGRDLRVGLGRVLRRMELLLRARTVGVALLEMPRPGVNGGPPLGPRMLLRLRAVADRDLVGVLILRGARAVLVLSRAR